MTAIVCLGRLGDILNAFPIAEQVYKREGVKPKFVAAKAFWEILQSASYLEPVVWDVDYKDIGTHVQRFKAANPKTQTIVAQWYGYHQDQRKLTDSYQKEAWRIAGFLPEFGKHPLTIDQRDAYREADLLESTLRPFLTNPRPFVLVGLSGHSSPFKMAYKCLETLRKGIPEFDIIDLSQIKAKRPQDLLALYDSAKLLVSSDTLHLHLSRASQVPVVSIRNDGWFGSVVPEHTAGDFRYSSVTPESLLSCVKSAL